MSVRATFFIAPLIVCVLAGGAGAQPQDVDLEIPATPTTAPTTVPTTAPTRTWTYSGPGNWTQVDDAAPATQRADNPTLDRADRLLAARRHQPARKVLLDWLRKNPKAPDRDRGVFLLAEAYFQYGDRVRAFYHLDELLDLHPESNLFYPALEKQYD